jgi:hypothetical protein
VIRNHEQTTATYKSAMPRLAGSAPAAALTGRILAAHENHDQRVREHLAPNASPAAA